MGASDRLERWFERRYGIRPIGEGGYILRLGLIRHRGPRVALRDGTVIERGDVVAELHLDNRRAAALHREGKGGVRFRREVFRTFPALAGDLATRPEYREVNACCGASLFWAAAAHAGFEHRPLDAFTRWWLGWWERYLLARYHPGGRRRLAAGHRTEVRQVWISRRAILRFLRRGADGRAAEGRGMDDHGAANGGDTGDHGADGPLASGRRAGDHARDGPAADSRGVDATPVPPGASAGAPPRSRDRGAP